MITLEYRLMEISSTDLVKHAILTQKGELYIQTETPIKNSIR